MWRKRQINQKIARDNMRWIEDLTDDEIEECVDGNTNIDMIREILTKPGVIIDNVIDSIEFAEWFAYGIEGYIDADEDTEEWNEAYENNRQWGENIAENINDYILS